MAQQVKHPTSVQVMISGQFVSLSCADSSSLEFPLDSVSSSLFPSSARALSLSLKHYKKTKKNKNTNSNRIVTEGSVVREHGQRPPVRSEVTLVEVRTGLG